MLDILDRTGLNLSISSPTIRHVDTSAMVLVSGMVKTQEDILPTIVMVGAPIRIATTVSNNGRSSSGVCCSHRIRRMNKNLIDGKLKASERKRNRICKKT